ncbi:hypothetical protein Poli38472_013160 [Pythium oligandrum]|uniref:EF-hand domain-containing protein n=1 Tax=Pythium oligandrum TaxID=41045 RepID=A0A8K1C2H4_PYTOL|nr:hypothetical protein Poli38472_013160 [Pythium oligandrum]|eukprot:TMW55269.1 hypothetical protein Poli38472_013160 [Pythium oligandrum]
MDKVSEVSLPTRTASVCSSSTGTKSQLTAEDDAAALIRSFRRKKYVRARLLPLESDIPAVSSPSQWHLQRRPPKTSPARTRTQPTTAMTAQTKGLSIDKQAILMRLPDAETSNNRENDIPEAETTDIERLQRVHALLTSDKEIQQWINTYETEKSSFSSFALCTEMKLDEIQDKYVSLAGRPNAVEAAACCATLLKMPGIVGCYRTLLQKLTLGILSVVYVPSTKTDDLPADTEAMTMLVRGFYARKTYFQRVLELETQLGTARSLTDAQTLRSLTIDEVTELVRHVPFRVMTYGLLGAYAQHFPHLEQLLRHVQSKIKQCQRDFYRQYGRKMPRSSISHGKSDDDDDEHEGLDPEDPAYPLQIPLTTSTQICRAISQHAVLFSASGKEMILCSILEFVDVDSFKDVFKRFDAHGKTCFLHHLSVLESSEHLQFILEKLPNGGDLLFRFYYALCGAGGGGRDECKASASAKHVFFQKILSPEMEYFFLCDLAPYLNDDQWQLLSQEYEKHVQERKARRRRLRRSQDAGFDEDVDDDDDVEDDAEDQQGNAQRGGAQSKLEHFQVLVWNYIHHQRFTSVQVCSLFQTALLPSLEEKELIACIDLCMEKLALDVQWKKLLARMEELDTERPSTAEPRSPEQQEAVRGVRGAILQRLYSGLTREERVSWLTKTAGKLGLTVVNPAMASKETKSKKSVEPVPAAVAASTQPLAPAFNLEDPKSVISKLRMDLKIKWLEALLEMITTDKETSARTTMLKQMLLPFLQGQQPPANTTITTQETKPTPVDAEKAIMDIISRLNEADAARVWRKVLPESIVPKPKSMLDRATSPILELQIQENVSRQPTPVVPEPESPPQPWYAALAPNSEVATAFQALLADKTEQQVLEILRNGLKPAELEKTSSQEHEEDDDERHGLDNFRSTMVKRKLSAVLAVAEPMEWQERVRIGMLDVSTQTMEIEPETSTALVEPTPSKPPPRAPLTMNALLGRAANAAASSPKKKDAKYQKLNSTAVPRSVSTLITSWRVNTDQLLQFAKKSMQTVLRLIADAYGEMLTAGRRKATAQAAGNSTVTGRQIKDLTLAQIVYQQFLHSYGLPGIADMHLLAFSCATEAYRTQHLRVELFARFVFEEVPKLELSNLLEFLECLVSDDNSTASGASNTTNSNSSSNNSANQSMNGNPTTKRQRFVPRIVVPDKENWQIPLEKAQEAAQLCFRAMRKQAVTAFCDRLTLLALNGSTSFVPVYTNTGRAGPTVDSGRMSPGIPLAAPTTTASSDNSALMLNVDHLLQLVVEEWREEQLRREGHLLNVFRAGDVNGDGQLTSAEFTQIVLTIDHTRELDDILLMYSETLRRTECESINADVFLQVAKEYELDRAAWNGDGELRNIVNDMNELNATWSHVRPFFLGTLEALVRDLPTLHFLRVCEGAGCGCLKCILDGYIGFQRMRREYFTSNNPRLLPSGLAVLSKRTSVVSEALVWARFWHLMRQLYEAVAESPGIITAWEGANYMRVDPVPRLAPRYLKFRRPALPNILFPDTNRISAMMSRMHDPEAFDAETIRQQFHRLLQLMMYNTSGSGVGEGSVVSSE